MYDVIIIGAGVCGAAVARELSRYRVNACVLEKRGERLLRDVQSQQRNCSRRI